jgi:hypothetical protein
MLRGHLPSPGAVLGEALDNALRRCVMHSEEEEGQDEQTAPLHC